MNHYRKIFVGLRNILKEFFSLAFHLSKLFFHALLDFRIKEFAFLIARRVYRSFYYFRDTLLQDLGQMHEGLEINDTSATINLRQYDRCLGLHSFLDQGTPRSYSILIPVYKPDVRFFREAVLSCLYQTAPHYEVLLGYDGPQSDAVYQVIADLKKEIPKAEKVLREISVIRTPERFGISSTTNALADNATGEFLILVDQDDYIRPDLLYRYAQTLNAAKEACNTILYCDEYKIDQNGRTLPGTVLRKPDRPPFPYIFVNFVCHCLMVPKNLWMAAKGLDSECDGAQDFDLVLRLDLLKAEFKNIPIPLYAWRTHSASTAQDMGSKSYVSQAGVKALQKYMSARHIEGKIREGKFAGTYRIVPAPIKNRIVAIMPFKDQKEMTIKAVLALKAQQGITRLDILCIDNNSNDKTIIDELQKLGVQTLTLHEPFNYSRINNTGIRHLSDLNPEDLILLINNDVELEKHAIAEMAQLTALPDVGIVGCLLTYPNGRIQHGGIFLNRDGKANEMAWRYYDGYKKPEEGGFSSNLMVVDAVTAACAILKKRVFEEAGGFDENFFPIAFSDTDLCVRITRLGYHSLYTPFAQGTHYESASRGRNYYEDYEGSRWLLEQLGRDFEPKTPYYL